MANKKITKVEPSSPLWGLLRRMKEEVEGVQSRLTSLQGEFIREQAAHRERMTALYKQLEEAVGHKVGSADVEYMDHGVAFLEEGCHRCAEGEHDHDGEDAPQNRVLN
jgi:hypothetical protein